MQNIILFLLTGFVPLIIGFLYYNNAFGLGKIWMRENGFTEEYLQKNFSPLKVFGSAYLLGILIAAALMPMTVHQMGLTSMFANDVAMKDPNSELYRTVNGLLKTYGTNFRSFGHGAIHGLIYSIFLVFPLIGINALFERRSWKYILLHTGYWIITLMIMGGLVCQFLDISSF